ncbi:MAG: hypothetical protein CVU54_17755 [Deltaproteobacteria bacterium HGW-Deltaproteobacteria-12]|jgi:hypothetical protein|nr:MAG: hypothetical protein CVU54_17755 [Deltaproteobacteria bacterium HGW-Deltaproteobacteria-12]
MKIRICLLAGIFFLLYGQAAQAQEFGKIRALQQRAAFVTNQKNDFVARVLTSYKIPYERNSQGAVVRINIEKTWFDITAIDIVPVLQESADKRQHVTAHELYFYTAGGILNLVSELIIR